MSFHYTAPASGSGGGTDLWEFTAGVNSDIELNAGAGVTGINAVLPSDNNLHKVLTIQGGIKMAGDIIDTGLQTLSMLVTKVGAALFAYFIFADNVTGENTGLAVQTGLCSIRANDGAGNFCDVETTFTRADMSAQDATGKNTQVVATSTQFTVDVNGAANSNEIELKENSFFLRTGIAPGTEYFGVMRTPGIVGQIRTNQTKAAGVVAPNGNCIEIFDMTGVSQGVLILNS